MEFGAFLEFNGRQGMSEADAFDEGMTYVDIAEKGGLDSVWLAELHFIPRRSVLSSPPVVGAAIASRTKRLKVGTAVRVLPLGNPLRIAEEIATLDHVLKGRFEFGVGRSGGLGTYQAFGVSYDGSRDRLYEYLDVILKAWTNERFSHKGTYFSCDDVCIVPKPYQSPHPPVRIAATTSNTFTFLGHKGFHIFMALQSLGIDTVAEQVRSYKKAWKESCHQGEPSALLRIPMYVGETREDALTVPRESHMTQLRNLGERMAAGKVVGPTAESGEDIAHYARRLLGLSWEEVVREQVVVGTPEMVVDRLHELRERLQPSGVIFELNAGVMIPREKIARSLQLFCDKVMPVFK